MFAQWQRSRDNFLEIQEHAITALGAIEGQRFIQIEHETVELAMEELQNNEMESAATQVDCVREILKLCKVILETSAVTPAKNLDHETFRPTELVRTSWEACLEQVRSQDKVLVGSCW